MMNILEKIEHWESHYSLVIDLNSFIKVKLKINESKRVNKLLKDSRIGRIAPLGGDYVITITRIPYFMIKSPNIRAWASLLAFKRWINEVNNELQLMNDEELEKVLNQIINRFN